MASRKRGKAPRTRKGRRTPTIPLLMVFAPLIASAALAGLYGLRRCACYDEGYADGKAAERRRIEDAISEEDDDDAR